MNPDIAVAIARYLSWYDRHIFMRVSHAIYRRMHTPYVSLALGILPPTQSRAVLTFSHAYTVIACIDTLTIVLPWLRPHLQPVCELAAFLIPQRVHRELYNAGRYTQSIMDHVLSYDDPELFWAVHRETPTVISVHMLGPRVLADIIARYPDQVDMLAYRVCSSHEHGGSYIHVSHFRHFRWIESIAMFVERATPCRDKAYYLATHVRSYPEYIQRIYAAIGAVEVNTYSDIVRALSSSNIVCPVRALEICTPSELADILPQLGISRAVPYEYLARMLDHPRIPEYLRLKTAMAVGRTDILDTISIQLLCRLYQHSQHAKSLAYIVQREPRMSVYLGSTLPVYPSHIRLENRLALHAQAGDDRMRLLSGTPSREVLACAIPHITQDTHDPELVLCGYAAAIPGMSHIVFQILSAHGLPHDLFRAQKSESP